MPDGMTIDSEDNLWVANHGGGHVSIFGRILQNLYLSL